jgi:hypothetical protein
MAAGTVTDSGFMKRPAPLAIPSGGALLCAAFLCAGLPGAVPAFAQFNGPFDAPRPPGSVGRPQPQQPQPQWQAPSQQAPSQQAPSQQAPSQQVPPQQMPQQQAVAPAPRPGGIQSEDLPAPGGRQRPGPPGPPPQAAVPAAVPAPAPAEVVTAPPAQRIGNPTAVFAGLDKITGRITSFDSAIGETVQFGALQVTARACYSRPPTETPLTDGFVEVDEVTLQGEVRRIFTGWMFAASPGLHGVEHAVYDVWLVDCKGGAQAADPPPATPASAAPSRQQQPRQGQGGQGGGQGTPQQRPQRQPAAPPSPPAPIR